MPSFTDIPESLRTCAAKSDFLVWLRDQAVTWSVKKEIIFIWAKATQCPISYTDIEFVDGHPPSTG